MVAPAAGEVEVATTATVEVREVLRDEAGVVAWICPSANCVSWKGLH